MTLWDGRRVPVTLLGGYLGAGKTTIVNHVLADAGGRRIAVLVNDLGSVQVDAALIAARHDDTIELANGCVCCSLVDGFAVALETLRTRPAPDHVLIELSGVAEPARVVPWTATAGFRLDGIVVAVDADQIMERAADPRLRDLVTTQVRSADILLVTKSDLADRRDGLAAWLRARSEAPQVAVTKGSVDPDVVLGVGRSRVDLPQGDRAAHEHPYGVARVPVVAPERLEAALARLPPDVVRVKGTVLTTSGPRTIQCVGHRRVLDAHDGPVDGRVVVIGLDVGSVDQAVRLLESPTEEPTP